ncbi:MAG: aminotransferase class III-fold pyridoxal phosphate-dependent enzyme, partial [Opitutaceae bacterium]|nr:aminotransferase class III-fold pyridoxal phosphate-dependent enzyme [Opitutaceae bacterium]
MSTLTSTELRAIDQAHLLHPFTDHVPMHAAGTHIITRAEGCHVFDIEGRRLLDGLAGLWCVNVGYNRPEIAAAIQKQLGTLCYYPSFFN